ncbi:MAG TPA: cation transporter [Pseudonocardiaceae bacterium]
MDLVHEVTGLREPTDILGTRFDDTDKRRQANRAVSVSALGLAATGLIELVIALITGSVGLLGDALHNLSDVSTSLAVFLGFRISRRAASERYPYGLASLRPAKPGRSGSSVNLRDGLNPRQEPTTSAGDAPQVSTTRERRASGIEI